MDEDIIIPLIVFSFILALVWTFISHSRWKYQQKQKSAEGSSLGTSELKALMREAVEEANAPLLGRIELLEAQLRDLKTHRLMPASDEDRLELPEQGSEPESTPAARRVTDRR